MNASGEGSAHLTTTSSATSSPLSSARSHITIPSDVEEFEETFQLNAPEVFSSDIPRTSAKETIFRQVALSLSQTGATNSPGRPLHSTPESAAEPEPPATKDTPIVEQTISSHGEIQSPATANFPNGAGIIPVHEESPDSLHDTQPDRPKRERKATQKFEDPMCQSAAPRTKRLHRAAKEPNYSAKFVMTSEKSILAKLDLDKLLSDDRAWNTLPRESQEALLAQLPNTNPAPTFGPDEPIPNLPRQLMKGSSAFRTDLRIFQEDLSEGRLDKEWRRQAEAAMAERSEGKFDNWKNEEREEFWGQKMKGINA